LKWSRGNSNPLPLRRAKAAVGLLSITLETDLAGEAQLDTRLNAPRKADRKPEEPRYIWSEDTNIESL
jgi:hypothetical protein